MTKKPIIMWFRQDLRLKDNPALTKALETDRLVIPLYIHDEVNCGEWKRGEANKWWLHQSLQSLSNSLNVELCLKSGDPKDIIPKLLEETDAAGIYWNRSYDPWQIERDKQIKAGLKDKNYDVQSFAGIVMYEPHTTHKDDDTPYKVFTPFYKKGCLKKNGQPRESYGIPDLKNIIEHKALSLNDLKLLPNISWYKKFEDLWQPGEDGAQKRLKDFLEHGLDNYKDGRNHPSWDNVSRLSPHLHHGEISPNDVWYQASAKIVSDGLERDGGHFLSELGWREFSNNLLYHFPELPRQNLQKKFDNFPWRDDPEGLKAWQKGQTGYPIVDAAMRELYETGYMHNRPRMIVGSFLVKNLMIHWHHGEDWFWDTLCDADLANNSASWQWIAGCGADAAPYFRVFNPITQSQKFDKDGDYIRKYVSELKDLPNKYLHEPWTAPDNVLQQAGITLGETYPEPIVDLKATRERALEAFSSISGST